MSIKSKARRLGEKQVGIPAPESAVGLRDSRDGSDYGYEFNLFQFFKDLFERAGYVHIHPDSHLLACGMDGRFHLSRQYE